MFVSDQVTCSQLAEKREALQAVLAQEQAARAAQTDMAMHASADTLLSKARASGMRRLDTH